MPLVFRQSLVNVEVDGHRDLLARHIVYRYTVIAGLFDLKFFAGFWSSLSRNIL